MSKALSRILKPAGGAAGLAMLIAAAGVLTQSSETLLRRSFDRALAPQTEPEAGRLAQTPPIAGSEEFWLTAVNRTGPTGHSVSLGDKITLTLGGKERSYRVISVGDISPGTTQIDSRARVDRLLLITAKDAADALSQPIRFVIDTGATTPALSDARPARAS